MTQAFDYLSLLAKDADDFELGFPSERWVLARQVSLSPNGKYLEFVYRESARGSVAGSLARSPQHLLMRFVEIAQGDEPAESNRLTGFPLLALNFGRKYGALGICNKHNLSCWHMVPPCPSLHGRNKDGIRVRERVAAWYTYSRLARAILNLVAKPHAPERRSDLNRLDSFFGRKVPGPATAVNYWLSVCRVNLRLHGESSSPRLGLFPVPAGLAQLGIQLALVVAGQRPMALCDGCGCLFPVERQPRQDRRRYCLKCGETVRSRQAQRRKRANPRTESDGAL